MIRASRSIQASMAAALSSLVIALANPAPAPAGKHHGSACCKCGCERLCRKVCRLERTDKVTPVTIWGVKCEEFCIGAPGEPQCDHCLMLHDNGAEKPPCSAPKAFVWTNWLPGRHAKIFTRKKLMKQVATVKTSSYQWVVEDLCPACCAACQPVDYPADAKIPPRPEVPDALVIAGVEEAIE